MHWVKSLNALGKRYDETDCWKLENERNLRESG
jgi:hypothetical protein